MKLALIDVLTASGNNSLAAVNQSLTKYLRLCVYVKVYTRVCVYALFITLIPILITLETCSHCSAF